MNDIVFHQSSWTRQRFSKQVSLTVAKWVDSDALGMFVFVIERKINLIAFNIIMAI